MRRGCVSLGNTICDDCQVVIPYPERYLAIDEVDGMEVEEGGTTRHYCIQCSLKKGYARYKSEKGEQALTFFPE